MSRRIGLNGGMSELGSAGQGITAGRAYVVSVNVARPEPVDYAGSVGQTAIAKHPVDGPVEVRELGLAGDQVGDTRHHGGVHQAIYVFAREDLDYWTEQLGEPVPPGLFGENLTTAGLDVNEAVLGEQWRVGTSLVSPCEVRIPCATFKGRMAEAGYDAKGWVKRFAATHRPGPYVRVLEEGVVCAGDEIVVEHRPDHGVTVSMMFRAFMGEPELLPELLAVEGLPDKVYRQVRKRQALDASVE